MSRSFEGFIDSLSKRSGYPYNYLVDMYNEVIREDGDVDYFVTVTMERDW